MEINYLLYPPALSHQELSLAKVPEPYRHGKQKCRSAYCHTTNDTGTEGNEPDGKQA